MTDYQKELIKEHKELCARIVTLETVLMECDDIVETINRHSQLHGMREYEDALKARLCNSGICVDGIIYRPVYFEHINTNNIISTITPVEETVSANNNNEPIKETTDENDVAK